MDDPASLFPDLPRSRAEARRLGRSRYIGSVCKRGHEPAVRQAANGMCHECHRAARNRPTLNPRPSAPASMPARLALVGNRIMHGMGLREALRSVSGAQWALARRLKIGDSTITGWFVRHGSCVSPEMAGRVALALNVPESRIPVFRRDPIARAGEAIRNGVPFNDAMTQAWAWADTARALGLTRTTPWRWKKHGVPSRYIPAIAKLLGCERSRVPVAIWRTRGPISEAERCRLAEAHRTPEFRAKASAIARSIPHVNGRWVKKNAPAQQAPRYRDLIDRVGDGYYGSASSLER